MKNLEYEQTDDTPLIRLSEDEKVFMIKGESFPENTFVFYEPVIEWIKECFAKKTDAEFDLDLVYINSSSLRVFFDIFEMLENSVTDHGSSITIVWKYHKDNDIALEIGEDFVSEYTKLDFTFKATEDV